MPSRVELVDGVLRLLAVVRLGGWEGFLPCIAAAVCTAERPSGAMRPGPPVTRGDAPVTRDAACLGARLSPRWASDALVSLRGTITHRAWRTVGSRWCSSARAVPPCGEARDIAPPWLHSAGRVAATTGWLRVRRVCATRSSSSSSSRAGTETPPLLSDVRHARALSPDKGMANASQGTGYKGRAPKPAADLVQYLEEAVSLLADAEGPADAEGRSLLVANVLTELEGACPSLLALPSRPH
jgi:hypothetical protein